MRSEFDVHRIAEFRTEVEEQRKLLVWVYQQTRDALFTKGNGKKASEIRDQALSAINHRLAHFREGSLV